MALAPLVAEGIGSFGLPALIGSGGALGADALGLGLSDAVLSSIGGGLAGAGAGALTDKKDPLTGALIGGASGAIGGPGIADLGTSAVQGVGSLIGDTATTAGAAGTDLAGGAASAAKGLGSAIPNAGASAAASAAPAAAGVTPSIAAAGPSVGSDALSAGTDVGGDLGKSLVSGGSLTGPGSLSSLAAPGAGVSGAPPTPPPAGIPALGAAPPSAGAAAPAIAPPGAVTPDISDAIASTVGGDTPPGLFDRSMAWLSRGNHGSELLSGLGLGATALQSNNKLPGEAQLAANAKLLGSQGRSLATGTLTPGMQAGLQGAKEAAKATVRSQMASVNMSGSSSEAEALANIDLRTEAQGAEMVEKLMQMGVDETNMSSQLYQQIMQNAWNQDQELQKAIGSFASSFAPRPAYQPGV